MSVAPYLRLLVIPFCCTLVSCQALWSSGSRNPGSGYSLDNPPSGRYLGDGRESAPPPSLSGPTLPSSPTTVQTDPPIESTDIVDPAAPPSTPTTTPTPSAPPVPPAPPESSAPAAPSYGKPVPGRQGFVYPPGVDAKPENMVDVRDFSPGQKVRDPRTGKIFLVP